MQATITTITILRTTSVAMILIVLQKPIALSSHPTDERYNVDSIGRAHQVFRLVLIPTIGWLVVHTSGRQLGQKVRR